jgi:type IV pilus assembly protein PilA
MVAMMLQFQKVGVKSCWREFPIMWGYRMRSQHSAAGFSLLELIVVVALILILAAIAIPNLQRSKMSANEASAVESLRTVNGACVIYSATWGTGFPVSLANMGPGTPPTSTSAGLVDSLLAAGTKTGYTFTYVSGPPQGGKILTYSVNGNPSLRGNTGNRHFFTDASGVIRYNYGSAASVSSAPI